MSASLEASAPAQNNSGAMYPAVPASAALVGSRDILDTRVQSPKSAMHARGGFLLLIRMLGCGSKIMDLILTTAFEMGITVELEAYSFEVGMNYTTFVKVIESFRNILQLWVSSVVSLWSSNSGRSHQVNPICLVFLNILKDISACH